MKDAKTGKEMQKYGPENKKGKYKEEEMRN